MTEENQCHLQFHIRRLTKFPNTGWCDSHSLSGVKFPATLASSQTRCTVNLSLQSHLASFPTLSLCFIVCLHSSSILVILFIISLLFFFFWNRGYSLKFSVTNHFVQNFIIKVKHLNTMPVDNLVESFNCCMTINFFQHFLYSFYDATTINM